MVAVVLSTWLMRRPFYGVSLVNTLPMCPSESPYIQNCLFYSKHRGISGVALCPTVLMGSIVLEIPLSHTVKNIASELYAFLMVF